MHHVPQNRQNPENAVRNLKTRQDRSNDARSPEYTWRDVKQDKPVEKWLNNLKPSSSEPYLYYLKSFCIYTGLNADQILKKAKSDKESIHDTLKAFRRKLEPQGDLSNTLQQGYMSVRSFLSWNGVKLDKTPTSLQRTRTVRESCAWKRSMRRKRQRVRTLSDSNQAIPMLPNPRLSLNQRRRITSLRRRPKHSANWRAKQHHRSLSRSLDSRVSQHATESGD